MKAIKYIFLAVVLLAAWGASAQWSTSGDHIYNNNIGSVGIGTTSPQYLLHAYKNMTGPQITIQNQGGLGGAGFTMIDDGSSTNWKFKSYSNAGKAGFKIRDHANSMDVITIENSSMANAIFIEAGGNVGIGGILNPQSTLAVNGKITCKEVEVTLDGWADYVFNDDYKLSPLSEVEKFIKENKHLPGIPSQQEIVKNGLSVGEMNVKFMEKIEELTLYIIELQKEIDNLKEK